ncbi:MAG: Pilus assembly protein [Dehalococcoidales bacterium]|nr:Pilus assembly protein [Dehalococcoidales bacterium]
MARKVTTLVIEDGAIRLLVASGKQIESWASSPLPPGLVGQGVVTDEAQVASRVKELFLNAEASPRGVVVGLSGLNSLYRVLTLPELKESMLPEAVMREAGRVIPTSLEEVYLSYQRVPAPKGETHVFLATFPRNATDALMRTLNMAGVVPHVMDLAPLALARIPNEPRTVVVNATSGCLDITVMVEKVPQVIRSLSLPSEGSLSDNLPIVAEEIERTIAFYNSSHTEKPLDATVPVFFSGDLVGVSDTWPGLVGGAGYPVSALSSPLEYPPGFPANEFMVNIGLAIKQLPLAREPANSSLVNFNALPKVYLPIAPSPARILVPVGAGIGVALLAYVAIQKQNVNTEIASLRSQLATVETNANKPRQDIEVLKKQIAQAEANLNQAKATESGLSDRLENLGSGREDIDKDLAEIVKQRPQAVTIGSINHSGGGAITISATSKTEADIWTFARRLRDSGRFASIWIPSVSGGAMVSGNVTVTEVTTVIDGIPITTNVTSTPQITRSFSFQLVLN